MRGQQKESWTHSFMVKIPRQARNITGEERAGKGAERIVLWSNMLEADARSAEEIMDA
jgi:hypothetical protein